MSSGATDCICLNDESILYKRYNRHFTSKSVY